MGCVIKYKGQEITEEEFLQKLNRQITVNKLFTQDSALANSVYESLGFNDAITSEEKQKAQELYSEYLESLESVEKTQSAESTQDNSSSEVQVISSDYGVVQVETNPTEQKTEEFINLIRPQIQAQTYKENKGSFANKMFHYGLMWARTNPKANPVKIQKFEGANNNYYNYHALDQNGNALPSIKVLQPIIDEIQKSLGIDMSDYDSVIGNIYLDDQYIYPHKDTTESKTARNYPVVVYTIGNNAGLGIVDNNNGKMTFANSYDSVNLPSGEKLKGYTNEILSKNGTIYTFGMDGKGRFELTHSTPTNSKKTKEYPPITLPNGEVVTNYTITLTFRRASDLTEGIPETPAKLSSQSSNESVISTQEVSQETINIYAGTKENIELSNFAIRPFTTNIETSTETKTQKFESVEQAFHYHKALTANDQKTAEKILQTTSGAQLRNLTSRNNLKMTSDQVKEWDDISKSLMLNLMYDSYAQNPEAAAKLLATGNAVITHTQDNTRWKTDFPEVVMTVRDMLREESEVQTDENVPNNTPSIEGFKDFVKDKNTSVVNSATKQEKLKLNAEEILEPYKKTNRADGQGYIKPSRFRELMIGLGRWEPKHQIAFDKLEAGKEVDPKDLLEMSSIKGVHYELVEGENGELIPVYLKYSQAVLWPNLVRGTKLENLLNKMKNEGTDEVIFASGIKVGKDQSVDMNAILEGNSQEKFSHITLLNKNWKLQTETPDKYEKKGESLVGSQARKNILMNLSKKKNGKKLAERLHFIESKISNLKTKAFKDKFNVKDNTINNTDKLYEKLGRKLTESRTNSNIMEQIKKRIPFDAIFQYKEKIEQELHSMVTKAAVKLTSPGGSFVQVSGVGFERITTSDDVDLNGVIWFKEEGTLSGPRFDEATGKLTHAEVLLPYKVVRKIPGYQYMKASELRSHISDDVLKGIIGYRIPNQGMSSIDSLEIVGILPPSIGDTIVTYLDVTSKTGSDFDIDKMYVMMPHVTYNEENLRLERIPSGYDSVEALENARIELWNEIMTAEDSFLEVISPVDSKWLKEDAYYISFLNESRENPDIWKEIGMGKDAFMKHPDKEGIANKFYKNRKLKGLEFASPAHQFEIKKRNMGGKIGIAQTANHAVHHVLAQGANLSFFDDILGDLLNVKTIDSFGTKKVVTDLGSSVNKAGNFITNTLSAWINAYVDNAKDPYISLINNNSYTANTVFMLLRAGADPKWVNRFMSQPILQDLSKAKSYSDNKTLPVDYEHYTKLSVYNGSVKKTNVKNAPIDFVTETARKWNPGDPSLSRMSISTDARSLDGFKDLDYLENQITNPDPEFQNAILIKFLQLQDYASKLNEAVRASKQDTDGATSSAAENLAARETYKKVVDDGYIMNFEKLFENTMLGTFKTNSQDLSDQLFKNLLFSKNKSVEFAVKAISRQLKKQYATDVELNKKIISDMYSYAYSTYDLFEIDNESFKELFVGSKSLARKVAYMQQMPQFKNNVLVQALGTKLNSDLTQPSFVTLASSKHKDLKDIDTLWLRWEEMLSDDKTVIVEGYTVKDFAEDLVKYAFFSSGFKKNINSFFDLIPNTYLNGELPNTLTYENSFADHIQNFAGKQDVYYENFIDQFFRHNWENDEIVPKVSSKVIVKTKQPFAFDQGIVLSSVDFPNRLNISRDPSIIDPVKYIKTKVKKDTYLYRYAGVKDGVHFYEAIEPLGLKSKGNVIVEYSSANVSVSNINPLRRGLPMEVVESLDVTDYDGGYMEEESDYEFGEPTIKESKGGKVITFEETDQAYFVIKQSNHPETGETVYNMVAVRISDGTEFTVSDYATTEDNAVEFGVETLRNMGVNMFHQGLKSACK